MIESECPDTKTAAGGTSNSRIPLLLCCLMILINVFRPQEIFPSLSSLRLGLVTIIAAIGAAIFSGKLTMYTIWGTRESRLVLAMWILGALSVLRSVWQYSAFETWSRLITINYFVFLGCAANCSTLSETRAQLWSFVTAGACLAGVVLISPTFIQGSSRAFTTLTYDPNDIALIMVAAIPVALSLMSGGIKAARVVLSITAVVFLMAILKTGSRGGVIGIVVVGFCLLRRPPGKRLGLARILIFAAAVLVMFSATGDLKERFSALLHGEDYNLSSESGSGEGRLIIWSDGLKLFMRKPLFGVGVGQFKTAMGQTYGDRSWVTAHNIYLQVLVELGIGGLALFAGMIHAVWRNTRISRQSVESGNRCDFLPLSSGIRNAMIGYLVCGTFLSAAYTVINPFLLSFSLGVVPKAGNGESTALPRGPDNAIS